MSDEQRKGEETEVEGHLKKWKASDEPQAGDEDENEVEGHLVKYN